MNKYSFVILMISGLVLLNAGCDSHTDSSVEAKEVQSTGFDIESAKMIIRERSAEFAKAHITGDIEILDDSFTVDAKILPPNAPAVIGHEAISKVNVAWIGYGITKFEQDIHALYGNQDYMIDEGAYEIIYGPENTVEVGKYINIWKQEEGKWKMLTNIWNTNAPGALY